jgi:hypothetical protein
MRQKSRLVLPCDPDYTVLREAEKCHQETREWLLQRERANIAPSIVPDAPEGDPPIEYRLTHQIREACWSAEAFRFENGRKKSKNGCQGGSK